MIDPPSIFETFGYIFFYPSCIIGPPFEFSDFRRFINLEGEYKEIPMFKCVFNSLLLFVQAIFLSITHIKGIKIFFPEFMLTESFVENNALYKVRIKLILIILTY